MIKTKLIRMKNHNNSSVIAFVSSRNNYAMLKGEVLKHINSDEVELINVDDNSIPEQIELGKKICQKYNIEFLENEQAGVQWATQTVINFINKNRPKCKILVCFQHDNYPISKDFFRRLNNIANKNDLKDVGLIGFNVLDFGKYTKWSYLKYLLGYRPLGMIGMLHLSIAERDSRWLCPKKQPELIKNEKWKKPFFVEFPMWAAIGINVENWNKYITPSSEYQFHLWLPDVATQFNSKNIGSIVHPGLYCFNNQWLKLKYGIPKNSALAAKKGNSFYFGEYSPFEAWKSRWGWEYEKARDTFPIDKYKDTILEKFFKNNIKDGPISNIELKE